MTDLATIQQEALDGSPATVTDEDDYLYIKFQCGPVLGAGINGTTIEAVIAVLVNRLQGFQDGPFKCRENALAITKLEEAKMWLRHRTEDRESRGVEGKSQA